MKRAFDWQRNEESHIFKFFVWKKSMMLRANIEFAVIIIYSLVFLELIIIFVSDLHKAEEEARILLQVRNEFYGVEGTTVSDEHRNLAS